MKSQTTALLLVLMIGYNVASQSVGLKPLSSVRNNPFLAKVRSSFSKHFSHKEYNDEELVANASIFNIGLDEDGLINLASLTNFSNAFNQDKNGLILVFDFETAFTLGLKKKDIKFQCYQGVQEYCYNHYVPITAQGNEFKFAISMMLMTFGLSLDGEIEHVHSLSKAMLENKCFGDKNNFGSISVDLNLDVWECFELSFNQVDALRSRGFNFVTDFVSDFLHVYKNEDGSHSNEALDFMASEGSILNPYTGNILDPHPPIYNSLTTGPIVFNDAKFVAEELCAEVESNSAYQNCLTPNNSE